MAGLIHGIDRRKNGVIDVTNRLLISVDVVADEGFKEMLYEPCSRGHAWQENC